MSSVDPNRGVRFVAYGPVQVFNDRGMCHIASEPYPHNMFWGLALHAWRIVAWSFELHPGIFVALLALLIIPILLLFLLGIPLWIWSQWGPGVKADRAGVHLKRTVTHWDQIEGVLADNVEWREGERPTIRPAVVLDLGEERVALMVGTFDLADSIATQLEFLRRRSRGTPEDIPDALQHARQAAPWDLTGPGSSS